MGCLRLVVCLFYGWGFMWLQVGWLLWLLLRLFPALIVNSVGIF